MSWEAFQSRRRMPVLDGVRAVAVLLVVVGHGAYQPLWDHLNGGSGVTMFFILSGFLITTLLLREEHRRGTVGFAGFYVRRLFRIAPLYLLAVGAYCLVIFGFGVQGHRSDALADQLPYYLLFFPEHGREHWALFAGPPFSQAWSLGLEEKFYFVWPLVGFALLRMRTAGRLAVCALVFVAAAYLVDAWRYGPLVGGYGAMAIGCAAAIGLQDRRSYRWLSRVGETVPFAVVVGVFLVTQFAVRGGGTLRDVVFQGSVALLLVGLVVTERPRIGLLATHPFLLVGRLSYGLYLFQGFGLKASDGLVDTRSGVPGALAGMAIAVAINLVLCYALHVTVEKPLIAVGHGLSRRLTQAPPALRQAASPTRV